MQIAMVGLGRMGANMVRRLLKYGHDCVVFDVNPANVEALVREGATGATSPADLVAKLTPPRTVWLMLPAAITPKIARDFAALLQSGDAIVDGGNSFYREAIDLAAEFSPRGIDVIDTGTSGGVWGLERGYSLMIGGPKPAVERLDPIFASLAPRRRAGYRERPRNRHGTARLPALRPSGAGHFVKMVHNGIEYGVMAAYAEGLNILKAANLGTQPRTADAETAPLTHPQYYQFDIDLPPSPKSGGTVRSSAPGSST